MMQKKRDLARLLALMIVFSSLFVLGINWSFVTDWNAYSNLAGQLQALSTLPIWIIVVGAALLVTDRRVGYWLLVPGTVLATIGQGFSYVPFVPWFSWKPLVGLVLMHLTNFAVVVLIGYYYLKEPRPAGVS